MQTAGDTHFACGANCNLASTSGGVIGVVKTFGLNNATVAANPDHVNYWHKDHLGSLVAVSNASGAVLERMAYDAWGKRLFPNGTTDPNGQINPASTDRGYTGHEHLDELGFVHMNGRIYDPLLGRFLSPDPHIQDEALLQNYNRYSYVLNNPLRYTDPTGEWIQVVQAFALVIGAALADSNNKDLKIVGSLMMMAASMGTSNEHGLILSLTKEPISAAFLSATLSSTISSGSLREGLKSGAFAAAFAYVGAQNLGYYEGVLVHALLGCAQQASSGGQCGPGAAAAAFGKAVSGADIFKETGPSLTQAVATVVVGGTVSVIGGGKFANGAAQAGFGYLFNCLAHECFAQGRDAERTFRDYLNSSGTTGRAGLGFDRWYDSQDNFFFGRPDIFSENLRMVCDVKPDSIYGWGSGAEQISRYTLTGEYSAGTAAPLFGTQTSITLTGSMNRYEYRFGGNGLVIYRALDLSPMERALQRAIQDQANRVLMGPFPPKRRQGDPG